MVPQETHFKHNFTARTTMMPLLKKRYLYCQATPNQVHLEFGASLALFLVSFSVHFSQKAFGHIKTVVGMYGNTRALTSKTRDSANHTVHRYLKCALDLFH